jgi:lysophospholipase L1-like esterase
LRPLLPAIAVLAAAAITACGASAPLAASHGSHPVSARRQSAGPSQSAEPGQSAPPGLPGLASQPGSPETNYYLSLGDSLARGVQAGPGGESINTPHGYPDQLVAMLRRGDPGLQLAKLGCSGETTATFIHGRHCPYQAGSQLAAAVQFLRAHAGHVSLITLDLGANDPNSCFTAPILGTEPPCVAGPEPSTAANLTRILASLRAAAGPEVPIIGMTLYVPELPEWRYGQAGRADARLSEQAGEAFNQVLISVYQAAGARIADVSGVFHTTDFGGQVTVGRLRNLPRNVAAICAWTWICARPPRGRNKHPNAVGYAVIARAFLAADQGAGQGQAAGSPRRDLASEVASGWSAGLDSPRRGLAQGQVGVVLPVREKAVRDPSPGPRLEPYAYACSWASWTVASWNLVRPVGTRPGPKAG